MPKTSSLKTRLARDFPDIRFETSEDFFWSPSNATIYSPTPNSAREQLTLLHEVAHAVLGHKEFKRDIDLLKIERQAWEYVKATLAPVYGLETDEDTVEDAIDSYREWLHARSKCPVCSLTGIQTNTSHYHCLGCNHTWKVNDARRCGLKRYSLTN